MDDITEQQELSKEISDAISGPVGFGHDIDEDELLAELEMLQEEDLKAKILGVDQPVDLKLPSVPMNAIGGTSKSKPVKGRHVIKFIGLRSVG